MIINYITDQLKELFYQASNEYNVATWAQSMLLLVTCVIPCDYYVPEELLTLSKEIVDRAETNNCTIEMCQIKDGKKVNVFSVDYNKEKEMIIKWIQDRREEKMYY